MKVNISGIGVFDVSEECLPRLLSFLSDNKSVRVVEEASIRERVAGEYTGRE